ncbi:glycerophosphodiester phosphodiesterase [Haloechinothrix sp. LS1_15]|uniref:glycerophosphodiester phosphodiesterase n=1 Tax=Haloechinothrix sp. LS1_15 TaxID=2652248 RepID=UPI00294587A3|nr:glycerophosphodiester phosphodiesterase [Haloechinothrix sp. LS1_15]MDV6011102.1 glycerophosphodiester phosphodiesterase [Haloechinothrix sp. LS1_15]
MVRLLAVVCTVALCSLAAPAAAASPQHGYWFGENPWLDRQVLHIAHQGGEIEAPSNTLYAFHTALVKGADMLEMDIHATADGELVVIHDATVDRTTDGSGRVDELTLDEIRQLDAAHWFVPGCGTCHGQPERDYTYRGFATGDRTIPPALGDFEPADFRVPTLREVLEEFPDTYLTIEIKATVPDTEPYEEELAALLNEFDRDTDTIVASFSDLASERFKRHDTEVSTSPGTFQAALFWASVQGPLPGLPNPRHHALQVPISFEGIDVVDRNFMARAHANGLAVHVWTINDREEMEWLLDIGVDGIMTDRPTMLQELLDERGVGYPG